MKARSFFYVCAGLFLLALTYQLGARSATAQATPNIEAVGYDNGALFAVVNGSWLQFDVNAGAVVVTYPLPVASPVVGIGNHLVVYENGDVYVSQGSPSQWVLKGNLAGGPTPAQIETWGAMKSRYRGERGAAQPTHSGAR